MALISVLRSLSLNRALSVLLTLMVFLHGTLLAPQLSAGSSSAGSSSAGSSSTGSSSSIDTAAAASTARWTAVAAAAPMWRAQPDARRCRWCRRTTAARRPGVHHLPEVISGSSEWAVCSMSAPERCMVCLEDHQGVQLADA